MSSSPDCELDSNSEDDIELTTSPLRSSEQYEIHHDAGRDDRLDFIGTDALDVHTAGLAPKTARLPQSKDSSNTFESLASSSSVRPTLYHLYSHDEANAIDLTDVGPASDKITIKALRYSGEADLDHQRLIQYVAEFVADCDAGFAIGVICSPPTASFVNDVYRALDKGDRYGRRGLQHQDTCMVKAETCMMLRSITMCREAASLLPITSLGVLRVDLALVPLEFIEFLSMPKVKTHVAKSSYILASSADIKTERVPPPMLAPYRTWFGSGCLRRS